MAQITWCAVAVLVLAMTTSRFAVGQQSKRPYDGIQAGFDAYQLGEERRQSNVGQQLYLNDLSRARLTPLAAYGYGYRPFVGTFGISSASLDYAYGYSNSPLSYGVGGYSGRPLTVFEPWPYVPGDIWGDLYIPGLRQPFAQVQTQAGPKRWESHPVYSPPLAIRSVLPPVNSPSLSNTPYSSEFPSPTIGTHEKTSPSRPVDVRSSVPVPPSPGPSIDDERPPPRRREF